MEVAEEEGARLATQTLQPIRDALHALDYWPDTEHQAPAKPKNRTAMRLVG